MKTYIALAATLLLFASGCGDDKPSVDDQRLEKVHQKAPSWEDHSDKEILDIMDQVCKGEMPEQPAGVTLRDFGYVVGIAGATCDK